MKMSYLIATVLLSLGIQAKAGQCTDKDYSAALGEVRNQQDMGWCYANTAADLISYHYRKELQGSRVSAAHVAIINNSFIRPDPYSESGTMRFSAKAAMHYGLCLENTEREALMRGPPGSLNMKLVRLKEMKELFDAGNLPELNKRLDSYVSQNSILMDHSRESIMAVLKQSTARNFPFNFANFLCGDKRWNVPYYSWMTSSAHFGGVALGRGLMHHIDEELDKENVIGIGYFANFLTSTDGRKEGGHASVVVGRRWNNETMKCEYKIRNSWGPGCHVYTPEYNSTCERGHLWVDYETLKSNLVSITYFKK